MAEITAGMVKELREKTDAPMMECKKALTEAAGDMDKAEEILRVKLGSKATKAAARITAEGIVGISITADGKNGAIIEVNCETDFVAKNDEFLALTKGCAELVASKNPADVAALSALPFGEGTVESTRTALVGKIGENMSARRFVRIEAQGKLVSYIHGGAKVGVLVDLVGRVVDQQQPFKCLDHRVVDVRLGQHREGDALAGQQRVAVDDKALPHREDETVADGQFVEHRLAECVHVGGGAA